MKIGYRVGFAVCLCLGKLWAIPTAITYQGTLKDKGVPANGSRTMLFRITNQNGTQVFWSSGNRAVSVTNGLFSTHLTPTGVDWEGTTPYLEVSVEGQQLLPREPVQATVYAMVSNSVVDGAITPAKVGEGFGLVPSGLIAMFDVSCPIGWARYSGLDSRFPLGGTSFGATGGSITHSHGISSDGAHNHGGFTGKPNTILPSDAGSNFGGPDPEHLHSIAMDGAHNHGGGTAAGSSLPPYLTMVFCKKQ